MSTRMRSRSVGTCHTKKCLSSGRSPSLDLLPSSLPGLSMQYDSLTSFHSTRCTNEEIQTDDSWKTTSFEQKWLDESNANTYPDERLPFASCRNKLECSKLSFKETVCNSVSNVYTENLTLHHLDDPHFDLESLPDYLHNCINPFLSPCDVSCEDEGGHSSNVLPDKKDVLCSRTKRSHSSDSAVVLRDDSGAHSSLSTLAMNGKDICLFPSSQLYKRRSLMSVQSVSCPSLAMPSVVISDHSTGSPYTEDYIELSNDHLSVTLEDIGKQCSLQSCTLSTCSTASTLSTLSLDDDASHSDCSESSATSTSPKKPSAWRKVRNILHWSPFIQTYKNQKYPWVQLAGHQGNFKSGKHGTILKKLCGNEEYCLQLLINDELRSFVPKFNGREETPDGEIYLDMQDLLADFSNPCIMDVKIGVRTYLEEELAKAWEKAKLRKDMYEKMIKVDPNEPTEEEHLIKAVTKPRYMVWRETTSSTALLGFRIEGIKLRDGTSSKDFKTTKTKQQVIAAVKKFTKGFLNSPSMYLERLLSIMATLKISTFFANHELIGTSLLLVHDEDKAFIWLIDFAKTQPVPEGIQICHNVPWKVGSHEDGYLIGMENLISVLQEIAETSEQSQSSHHTTSNS